MTLMAPFLTPSPPRSIPGPEPGSRPFPAPVGSVGLAILLLSGFSAPAFAQERTSGLDAFWAEMSRTVEEGDFDGYASLYHDDAILVSGLAGTSYPISQALEGWRQGFLDTRAGAMKARVEFRFTRRLSDDTTAHETGIFHYETVDADGNRSGQYIHFEALLTRKEVWKLMMEYQKAVATPEEWAAAGGAEQ